MRVHVEYAPGLWQQEEIPEQRLARRLEELAAADAARMGRAGFARLRHTLGAWRFAGDPREAFSCSERMLLTCADDCDGITRLLGAAATAFGWPWRAWVGRPSWGALNLHTFPVIDGVPADWSGFCELAGNDKLGAGLSNPKLASIFDGIQKAITHPFWGAVLPSAAMVAAPGLGPGAALLAHALRQHEAL